MRVTARIWGTLVVAAPGGGAALPDTRLVPTRLTVEGDDLQAPRHVVADRVLHWRAYVPGELSIEMRSIEIRSDGLSDSGSWPRRRRRYRRSAQRPAG